VCCHNTIVGLITCKTTKSEVCEIISFVSNNECEFVAILSYVNNM